MLLLRCPLHGKQSAPLSVTYFCVLILESSELATEQVFGICLLKQIQFPSYYLHIFVLQLSLWPKEKYTFYKKIEIVVAEKPWYFKLFCMSWPRVVVVVSYHTT